jgi:signal transduction histidine kinase
VRRLVRVANHSSCGARTWLATRHGVKHVKVEGMSRNLHPIVRDEIYRVASEALRNAFRHAEAQTIEVELRYDQRQFRLRGPRLRRISTPFVVC